ncbi:hypothetical protein F2P81_021785 [Scophthalmus maximus]|uniref:General transcription factor II-I repeat domain-containing protein 2-like n=1 Tax=Scophthalmus maximus TaxID=52904 RepID=A0A6A4S2Z5_SCOMX|nr:hypothetical protein F2P81_021785 [Scophthalmus maximus]
MKDDQHSTVQHHGYSQYFISVKLHRIIELWICRKCFPYFYRQTVTRRIEDIAGNLEIQLQSKADNFEFFSLALDESCDVRDTAQLLIFVRGITKDFEIMEELAAMRSMKGTTTGSDLFTEVNACFDKLGLKWDKLACVTTNGCPNLTGKNVGLLKRMQDKVTEVNSELKLVFLHCIIHQNVLCKSVLKLNHVIDVITKTVNFIRARALNHSQFVSLLEEHETEHGDIGYHTAVRWLSLGKVLKRVWDLRSEIREFCDMKGKDIPELSDVNWMADLVFGVDVTALMNEINTKLQGKGLLAHEMHSLVKAFIRKLQFLSRQLEGNTLPHMQTLKEATPSTDHLRRYSSMLVALHVNFIRARALNHSQFVSLLEEHETEHGDIGYHTAVRWLSLGKVLKRVWDLRSEIREFCDMKGKDIPELSDVNWMADLVFGVDVTALMNEINTKLQGKGLLAHEMHSLVKAFIRKLQFLSRQLEGNTLPHMQTLKEATPSTDHLRRYSSMLVALHGEFSRRFQDFKTVEGEMHMISSSFTCSVDNAPSDVQLELFDVQSDIVLSERFKSVSLLDFYSSLKEENFTHEKACSEDVGSLWIDLHM